MAFDFYFAGTQNIETQNMLCAMGANLLRSYVNDKRSIQELFKHKQEGTWKGKLIIDSGAFTVHRKGGTIDVDTYIEFLNTNKDYIDRAIQIDDIPGVWGQVKTAEQVRTSPIKTWENYLYMVQRLERPQMLLPVFHQGEHLKYLEQMLNFRYSDGTPLEYICISGNKELTGKQRKQWYAKVFDVIVKSSNPNVKTHCLGSATMTDMSEFPFTSSDATSWLMTSATGSILTPFGPVLVSKEQRHDKSHILNMPQTCIDTIKQMCDEFNVPFEDLMESYIARSNFNCCYTFKASKEISFIPRNLKISGGLF